MHSGLKPVIYMFRMVFSIIGVVFRVKVLKIDAGRGTKMFFWKNRNKNILQSDFRRRAGKYVQIRAEDGTIFIHLHWIKREKDGLYISLTGMMKH